MTKQLPPTIKRPRERVQTTFTQPTKTKQSFGPECNINNIMARYEKTGVIEHLSNRQPIFGDFADLPDYQTALDIVYTAEDQFMQLPSQVRKFFNNDPSFMLSYMEDPKNKATCQELGLLPGDPVQKAPKTSAAVIKEPDPASPTLKA